MGVITISRQYGTHALEVAQEVAKQLNFEVFDKELLTYIAAEGQTQEDEVAKYDETALSPLEAFLRSLIRYAPAHEILGWTPGATRDSILWLPDQDRLRQEGSRFLDHEECLRLTQEVIRKLAKRGNVIVIGRAGALILQDASDALHIKLVADLNWRVMRIAQEQNLTVQKAKEKILSEDKRRSKYVWQFYRKDWEDPTLYHMVLNVGKLGVKRTAQLIVDGYRSLISASAAQ
ncbi:MAG: cytidylate kinase-like family protein [Armatimonadetes bacterium]|nr:cytidylate kinase-like family protein [Armatimonadota bacterium]MDW8121414.1 cytidylate kinase-like family protein [Armatimonadota bacterium]